MSLSLPRLRSDLDVLPSPSEEQPGLVLRDPYRYTEVMLVIPPPLIPALAFLDGEKTSADLLAFLNTRVSREIPARIVDQLIATLQSHGFLQTEEYYALREQRQHLFRQLPERRPSHAGIAYPDQPEALHAELAGYFQGLPARTGNGSRPLGIAAPHVSPFGGFQSYAHAYSALPKVSDEVTFVLLGTSHYGEPEKFGLTRKKFVTPLGSLPVDTELVDHLTKAAGDTVIVEDYCHSIEHSIEFQCVFLQHVLGASPRILPILCGSFFESLATGNAPESNPDLARFFDALGELAERHSSRLFWVLGVDLAHIGRRYGDNFDARAGEDRMETVRQSDLERLRYYCQGDRQSFFDLVKPEGDQLRWCGYSPLYTFLKAVPGARGKILNYEQWNIDEQSVVSFAALELTHAPEVSSPA